MRKRHFYCWGSLSILALLAGCKPPTAPSTTQPAPPMTAGAGGPTRKSAAQAQWELPDTDKPVITDAKGPTDAEVLAQAAQEYSRAMEKVLAKRAAAAARAQAANKQGGPDTSGDGSGVHFENPGHAARANDAGHGNLPGASVAGANLPGIDGRTNVPDPVTPSVSTPPSPSVTQTPPRADVPFNKDSPAVNTPLIVGQPRPLPASDDMAQKLARQVKDYPQDIASQLDWQLLQLLQGQSVPQLQSMAPLQAEDREMLSAVLDGLTNFRNALRADNNMLLSRKIRPMLEASERLKAQAELSIPTIALCTDVKGFGVYEPLEPARFPADTKEHRVIVYCEVENFASQLDDQKRWETKLTQDVVLYTEQNGLEVWRDKTPARPIVDYSRNRRHDFFIVKMVRLPANLTIGRYLLKVTVTDQEVNRVAENTVPIVIVAQ